MKIIKEKGEEITDNGRYINDRFLMMKLESLTLNEVFKPDQIQEEVKTYEIPRFLRDTDGNHNFPPELHPSITPNIYYGDRNCAGEYLTTNKSHLGVLEKFYEYLGRQIEKYLIVDVHLRSKLLRELKFAETPLAVDVDVDVNVNFDVDDVNVNDNSELNDEMDVAKDIETNPKQFLFKTFDEYMNARNNRKLWLKRCRIISIILHFKYPKVLEINQDVKIQQLKAQHQRQAWKSLTLPSEHNMKLKQQQRQSTVNNSKIPKSIMNCIDYLFRVDMFSNIVSIYAVPGSKAACHFDHIFPWVRGGTTNPLNKSRPQNIQLIHYIANLRKKDCLLQCIDPDMMIRGGGGGGGYSVEEFFRCLTSRNGDYGVSVVERCLGVHRADLIRVPKFMISECVMSEEAQNNNEEEFAGVEGGVKVRVEEEAISKVEALFEFERRGSNKFKFIHTRAIEELFPESMQDLSLEEKLEKIRHLLLLLQPK